jgi:hypothetical protein
MKRITDLKTKKNRGAIPVSFIAVHNILGSIMPTDYRMHKPLPSLAQEGK